MEGFNADWLYVSGDQRRATYTNLSPGQPINCLTDAAAWKNTGPGVKFTATNLNRCVAIF